jgi:hypothetical protein
VSKDHNGSEAAPRGGLPLLQSVPATPGLLSTHAARPTGRSKSRTLLRSALLSWSAAAALLPLSAGCNPSSGADSSAETAAAGAGPVSDEAIAAFQKELLELAFGAAAALPLDPHVKNRSRAQEEVVAACLDFHQPRRALRYIERIDDWRRGAGYADLAFYCARQGDRTEVRHYLDLARRIADDNAKDENAQAWRRDRIRVRIAQTHVLLGEAQEADAFEAGVVDSESGKVEAVKATRIDAGAFDEQVRALDAVFATGSFDRARNALETCAQLFDRFYDDADRRSQMEERIKTSCPKLPIPIRIERIAALAAFALDHRDPAKALALTEEAGRLAEGFKWLPQDRIPLAARLAGLRARGGDKDEGRRQADAARATFDAERGRIVDIYRAGALRPLAETYLSMADTAAARSVYARALEEGVVNPNSRPRAEDLSATCLSMALHAFEPDADLWARMRQNHGGLGPPW